MPPKKSSIVLNVEQFIHDIEERPAIWNRNFHCNKAFLEQMWDELSSEHKLPKVVLKAKWKGLRDNFRVEYKRIPRADNGEFLVEPAAFESKWTHYYALLFLTEHMRHRMPKNTASASEDGQQSQTSSSYLYGQQSQDCERTIVEPDLTNGLVRRLNDSDEEFDEDDIEDDYEETGGGGGGGGGGEEATQPPNLVSLLRQRKTAVTTPPAAHANSWTHASLSTSAIKTEDARTLLKLSGVGAAISCLNDDDTANSNSNDVEKEAQDLSKKSMSAAAAATVAAAIAAAVTSAAAASASVEPASNRLTEHTISGSSSSSSSCRLTNNLSTTTTTTTTTTMQSRTSPAIINFSTSSRCASPAAGLSVANIAAHIGASSSTSTSSSAASIKSSACISSLSIASASASAPLQTTPIKVVSVTNAIASQQHKKRSVSPPPLYNKAHHPLATAIVALSTKERSNGEDFALLHHAGGGNGMSAAVGSINGASNGGCGGGGGLGLGLGLHAGANNSHEHLNFTKHSYSNGLIPALKLKRPRLSEDSQFNGSSTMDTTSVSNASTTTSAAHSPLQNCAQPTTTSNGGGGGGGGGGVRGGGILCNAVGNETKKRTNSSSSSSRVPEDDDYHYLLSLHPYMKQMNAAQKLRIRTKFQKLIFKELYKKN